MLQLPSLSSSINWSHGLPATVPQDAVNDSCDKAAIYIARYLGASDVTIGRADMAALSLSRRFNMTCASSPSAVASQYDSASRPRRMRLILESNKQ